MAEEKIIEAEIQLPEAIVQHIQSFLSGKEAARTTILSKCWHNAWLTRPNLDFDQIYFLEDPHLYIHEDVSTFWEFMNKTVQRYENSNLKIASLRLMMYDFYTCYDKIIAANNVIIKAIKMGAIDLDITYQRENSLFSLPHEVFGSENLTRLSLNRCKISLGDGEVRCLGLKSLSFDSVYLHGDIFWDIISSCPLIENLSLSSCKVLHKAEFCYAYAYSIEILSLDRFNPYEFRKLKCIFLNEVKIHDSFFDDLSSTFPCLEDLTLVDCHGVNGIRIFSPSLEFINITESKMQMLSLTFDVPRIRIFKFSGIQVPSLSFKTGRSNWESDITLTCLSTQSDTWFLNLNELLTNLGQSKVWLKLNVTSLSFANLGKFQCLPKPIVENLTVHDPSSVCPTFFDTLLRFCHPVFLAQDMSGLFLNEESKNISFKKVGYNGLMNQASLLCYSANQSACGPCDLGEVIREFFDAAVSAWRPLLSDSLVRPGTEERIRVRLRWGQEPAIPE